MRVSGVAKKRDVISQGERLRAFIATALHGARFGARERLLPASHGEPLFRAGYSCHCKGTIACDTQTSTTTQEFTAADSAD